MKKLLSLVLTTLMVLTLAGCGGSSTETPAPEASGDKVVKVGVCIYKFDDNFMTLYRQELERYLKEDLSKDGVKYEVTVMDGKNDQAEQTNQVNNFIADGVDVLIMNLVQASAAPTVIEAAKAADIPVVFINREPTAEDLASYDKACYVGADARQSGTFQGQIVADLENKGDYNGNGVIDYVMIMGDPENVDAQYRTEFSIKALTDAGLEVNKLFEQRGDWDQSKGQELANTALTQFGNEIDVIFCNNDGMALGAAQAIAANGRTVGTDIALLGVDALTEVVQMVKDGTMTGTVLNDHIGQAHQAAEAAKIAVDGGTLEKNYTVDYVKVTQANADQFLK